MCASGIPREGPSEIMVANVLEVESLAVRFGDAKVLEDPTFSVPEGQRPRDHRAERLREDRALPYPHRLDPARREYSLASADADRLRSPEARHPAGPPAHRPRLPPREDLRVRRFRDRDRPRARAREPRRPGRAGRPSAPSPAASSSGSCSRARSREARPCCSSTNPPPASTSRARSSCTRRSTASAAGAAPDAAPHLARAEHRVPLRDERAVPEQDEAP